jgi:hypothetical protein
MLKINFKTKKILLWQYQLPLENDVSRYLNLRFVFWWLKKEEIYIVLCNA